MTTTLPGVRVTLNDSFFAANDVNLIAERLLIIAAGPTDIDSSLLYSPVLYQSEAAVVAALGEGSPCHVAYVQAIGSGASNIYIAPTDPTKTTALEKETELETALAFADSIEPGIIVPFGFYANEVNPTGDPIVKSISSIAGTTGDIVVTVTTTTAHGFNVGDTVVFTDLVQEYLNGTKVITEKISTTKFMVWANESTHAALAEDVAVSSLGTVTKTAKIITDNAKNLAATCFRLSRDLTPCVGVMGCVPIAPAATLPTAVEISSYVNALTASALDTVSGATFAPVANVRAALAAVDPDSGDDDTTLVDLGKYLFLFTGSVITRNQPAALTSPYEPVYTGCEAVAAGQVYRIPIDSAITNKAISNVIAITNTFSRAQKLALVNAKVNPICLNSSSEIVTLDGWTLANEDAVTGNSSVYERISTVRIVGEVSKALRLELDKFVGMQASSARMNSIETKLRSVLNAFKSQGVLRTADFQMVYNVTTGVLTVDVNLVPFGEIRVVEVSLSVKINA